MEAVCGRCGARFRTYPSAIKRGEGKHCSRACSNPARGRAGSANHNWAGGRYQLGSGYVAINTGIGTYALEHRAVMEGHLGRPLRPDEHVHHRNGIKSDNRLENLEILSVADHARRHAPGRRESRWIEIPCTGCGCALTRLASQVRRNPSPFCSRACYRDSGFQRGIGRRVAGGRQRSADGTWE